MFSLQNFSLGDDIMLKLDEEISNNKETFLLTLNVNIKIQIKI